MKRLLAVSILFMLALAVIGFQPAPTQALLLRTDVDSTFVVVDDANEVQWADLNRFKDLTYEGVLDEIDAMNLASLSGATDWHLASEAEVLLLLEEIITVGDAQNFDPTSSGLAADVALGRINKINPSESAETHAAASWSYGITLPDDSNDFQYKEIVSTNYLDKHAFTNLGAFVVSSAATSAPVPEPSTVFLLGSGVLGIVGASRRKLKK